MSKNFNEDNHIEICILCNIPTAKKVGEAADICNISFLILSEILTRKHIKESNFNFDFLWTNVVDLDVNEIIGYKIDSLSLYKSLVTQNENLGNPGFCIYVKNNKNICVGFVTFQYMWSNDNLVINNLNVLPSYKNKTIESDLIKCVKNFYIELHNNFLRHEKVFHRSIKYPTNIQSISPKEDLQHWFNNGFIQKNNSPKHVIWVYDYKIIDDIQKNTQMYFYIKNIKPNIIKFKEIISKYNIASNSLVSSFLFKRIFDSLKIQSNIINGYLVYNNAFYIRHTWINIHIEDEEVQIDPVVINGINLLNNQQKEHHTLLKSNWVLLLNQYHNIEKNKEILNGYKIITCYNNIKTKNFFKESIGAHKSISDSWINIFNELENISFFSNDAKAIRKIVLQEDIKDSFLHSINKNTFIKFYEEITFTTFIPSSLVNEKTQEKYFDQLHNNLLIMFNDIDGMYKLTKNPIGRVKDRTVDNVILRDDVQNFANSSNDALLSNKEFDFISYKMHCINMSFDNMDKYLLRVFSFISDYNIFISKFKITNLEPL